MNLYNRIPFFTEENIPYMINSLKRLQAKELGLSKGDRNAHNTIIFCLRQVFRKLHGEAVEFPENADIPELLADAPDYADMQKHRALTERDYAAATVYRYALTAVNEITDCYKGVMTA